MKFFFRNCTYFWQRYTINLTYASKLIEISCDLYQFVILMAVLVSFVYRFYC